MKMRRWDLLNLYKEDAAMWVERRAPRGRTGPAGVQAGLRYRLDLPEAAKCTGVFSAKNVVLGNWNVDEIYDIPMERRSF